MLRAAAGGSALTRAALLLVLALYAPCLQAQELPTNGVNGFSLHPPYFNLAEGTKITATATCGEDEPGRAIQDLYCKLVGGPVSGDPSQTIQGQYCDTCDSADSNRAHPITNAIDGTERWWQSPPLSRSTEYNQVNVTLDLGQLFHVAYVLVKFANSPRPDLWVLERSVDFGKTYQPWQFFASSKRDCIEQFGQRTIERIYRDNDVICTTEYSRIVPLENGEIVVSLVNGRPGAMNFSYSPVLREFTKATNIRLRFLRTNTLLGHLMGKALRDPTVTRRYYYSIKDISIGGRCVCNGHAEACNCDCQHNTCGPSCDHCCPGFNQLPWKPATTYSANECEPCNCHGHAFDCYYDPEVDQRRASLDIEGEFRGGGVCMECQHHTTGINCERCIPGYYRSPDHPLESPQACSKCQCESEFTDGTCEDHTGRCYCKPNYTGEHCDSCAEGYENFPSSCLFCCICCLFTHTHTHLLTLCVSLSVSATGLCDCNSLGTVPGGCDPTGRCVCRPEFTGPRCDVCVFPCTCDPRTSVNSSCSVAGHCHCRPNYSGSKCDQCAPGLYGFPSCSPDSCDPAGSGSCECKPYVEGVACNKCKPLYWNLSPDTLYGCSNCECNTGGTLSEVAECAQGNGQCYCKPNVCSGTCAVCKDRYFNLQKNNYFGCQGCQCDIGGSAGLSCGERNGRCRCRPNVEGPKCNQPRPDHYFPDLHHMKFEVEDGTMLDGRAVRFGYNPLEFEGFSWRGYAQMSPIQNAVKLTVYVGEADMYLTRFILRYVNTEAAISRGSEQAKQIVFTPSSEPTFANVPQNSFVEPFVLNPGTWTVVIEAEGILLDYLVLLPSAYYEAPLLQFEVTEPCTYSHTPDPSQKLVYCYRGERAHNCIMNELFNSVSVFSLCRSLAVDELKRVAVFTLSSDADVQLVADRSSFFLHKVFLIPHAQFTMEYLSPRVHCISTHGHFAPDSASCVPSRFQTPSQSLVLKDGQASSVPEQVLASPPDQSLADTSLVYSTRVHALGRYVFILHYHQPLHPTFPMQVYINGGRRANATFCPHGYGCRSVLISENQIILDVTDQEVIVTVRVPDDKTLWLDYVLVVPENSYSSTYLSEEPLDKSYDFISNCGQNSFYINPQTASPFCRNSATSLSAFFNNGALPCGCHEAGAESDMCQPFGGQCHCKPNVIGRDCSECATGYYGFPNCRPCNCGTRLCEPVTGECICPPRTLLPECVQCQPQTFGCHPLVGCEMCNCSPPGVTSQDINCDTNSGQCRCKTNVIGRQCDRCAPGFYGYPNCRPCNCNEAGTEKNVCDSVTGQCLCKENVEGPRCDQCSLGTFHLDPTNPKGCTKCFCFGATDRCRKSDKRRNEIINMEGWVLLRGDRQEVPVSVYLDQDLVEADLSDVPDVYQDLHWHAPQTYLGDKVSSYSGYLRYQLRTQTMRGDALYLPSEVSRPDVILKVHLHLILKPFRHAQTGNVVSREELMMVLVALESLQIRALHAQSAQAVSLQAAVLEGAEHLPTGRHANNVEICLCPASYQGDSCQQCAPGYYRDTKGLFLGKCVPCNCNGHSDQCLDGTGVCVDCRHNTAGDHCEKCQGGFRGNNSVDGHAVSCTSCPCPIFAIRCVEKPNQMQCLCMPGYAGPKCERCAPGFYGNPMVIGSTCQPCNCNDNSDPNMLFSDCHPITGECQSCMFDTAGPHCELCAPGYYGDAITAKNCTSNEMADRTAANEATVEEIKNKLNKFHQELTSLRDALNEAANNTALASEKNNANQKHLYLSLSSLSVSQVRVSVKFNGTSGVQVRTPSNLADLAAYTTLKFHIRLPRPARRRRQADNQQFVLYLGNKNVSHKEFMGMVLDGKRLRWLFNVGDQTAQGTMTQDISDTTFSSFFLERSDSHYHHHHHHVHHHHNYYKRLHHYCLYVCVFFFCVCRILQNGQMTMSSDEKTLYKKNVNGEGDSGLLNLATEDTVFYVGGYPESFTVNLCLKCDISFCGSFRPHVAMEVRVNSSSGLIFYAAAERSKTTMTLSVSEGRLILLVNGGRRKSSVMTKGKYDDGLWHTVSVIERDKATLTMDGINVLNKKFSFSGGKNALSGPVYIGGLPSDHKSPGFVGCIRDVKLNEEPLVLSHSVGVVPCYQQPLHPGVYFSPSGGHISVGKLHPFLLTKLSTPFLLHSVRPVSDSGLLLHAGTKKSQQLSVYLNQGEVTVLVNSGSGEFSVSLTPEDSLCDGHWHSIFSKSCIHHTYTLVLPLFPCATSLVGKFHYSLLNIPQPTVSDIITKWKQLETKATHSVNVCSVKH
uniref:Laminin, alpha 5 n=1 Tax=Astyanax mexicanus TaxID=7994 RepID=A0A8B9M1E1_ASTMX